MGNNQYNLGLNGLRGMAAVNVALSHFVAAFLPGILHNHYPNDFKAETHKIFIIELISHPFLSIFFSGHFAVVIFFVLSGYVLVLPYWSGMYGVIRQRFWARYPRLDIPIACSLVMSYLLYKCGLYGNIQAGNISGSNWFIGYYANNNFELVTALKSAIFADITRGNSFLNPPLWSLKIEFIASLIILGIYSFKPKGFDILVLIGSCVFMWFLFRENSIYYICFLIGSIMGKFFTSPGAMLTKKIIRLAPFIFGLGYYFGGFVYEHSLYDWLPRIQPFDIKAFYNALGAVLMVWSVASGFGKAFFESTVLRFLGKISFSVYLVHFLILCSFSAFLYLLLPKTFLGVAFTLATYIMACLVMGSIFEYFIDSKAVDFSRKLSLMMTEYIKNNRL